MTALVLSLFMLAPAALYPIVAGGLVIGGAVMLPGSVVGQSVIARRRVTAAFALEASGFDLACIALIAGGLAKLANLWTGLADVILGGNRDPADRAGHLSILAAGDRPTTKHCLRELGRSWIDGRCEMTSAFSSVVGDGRQPAGRRK